MATIPEIETLARGFMPSRIILTGVDLDLFGALGDDEETASRIAGRVGADPRAIEILCNALVALGLLTKREDRYRNTEESLRFLGAQSGSFRGGALRHMAGLWDSWSRLTEIVRTGRGGRNREFGRDQQIAFIQAMEHVSRTTAGTFASALDLSGVRRMLDMGGGPAAYSIAAARRNPALQAVVFDLPVPLEIAREAIREAGLSDRIQTKEGDFFRDEPGNGYDMVLLSAIIHSYDADHNLTLLKRANKALNSGGMMVIRDFLVDDSHTAPAQAAIFAINMLVNTERGRTYSFREVSSWLQQTGFTDVGLIDLDGRSQLVTARKE
jgi:predicted O-methyltransferase YrrM